MAYKFLDDNGLLYYNQKIQLLLNGKQATLTAGQLAVLAGEVFTAALLTKLNGIEDGAEVNLVNGITVNGTAVAPDESGIVAITVPTNYVQSIAAGSANVIIGGTAQNPTIDIVPLEMPDLFTSTETETGAIGTALTGLDATALTAVITGAVLTIGDTVIFTNGTQAQITAIDNDEYDAIIINVPVAASFPGITGDPMQNTALAALLNVKLNLNQGTANAGYWLRVGPDGNVTLDSITAITNAEIDTIMA